MLYFGLFEKCFLVVLRGKALISAWSWISWAGAKAQSCGVLVSDFISTEYEKSLKRAQSHHDVIAVTSTDPSELSLPDVGIVELEMRKPASVFWWIAVLQICVGYFLRKV